MGNLKSKLCAYLFLTTPVAFFNQFIFGQYDIFTLALMLLGIYFYLKNDMWKFVLFFGLAITFKYFALLFFLPLLLLKEKKYGKLLLRCIGVAVPIALLTLIYIGSEAFRNGVLGFNPVSFIFNTGFGIFGDIRLSVVIVAFVLCCAWAYFTEPKDKVDEVKWMFFLSNVVVFIYFGLSMWHPQWILLAAPFMVISTLINKKADIFLILDMLIMFFFVTFTINQWHRHVDQDLWRLGIFRSMTLGATFQITMSDVLLLTDKSISYSAFSAILLINAVFKHPRYCIDRFSEKIDTLWGLVRARFIVGVSIFVIPAIICLVAAFTMPPAPSVVFEPASDELIPIGPITSEMRVAQVITLLDVETLTSVEVMFGTFMRVNTSSLILTIEDQNTSEILYQTNIGASGLRDNQFHRISLPRVPVQSGHQYAIVFTTNEQSEENAVAIWAYKSSDVHDDSYVMINDGRLGDISSLAIRVFGR
jgi:hypothetical protein